MPDAVDLLIEDHREVQDLCKKYEAAKNDDDLKVAIAEQICLALRVHTQIEEEIFYPAVRGALDDAEQIDEAVVEHQTAKSLIEQVESGDVEDPLYDAKVKVLGELVEHHVKEEETEMFPEVRASGLDLEALGERMARRREELGVQLGGEYAEGEAGGREAEEGPPPRI